MTSMKKINKSKLTIWLLVVSLAVSSVAPSLVYARETEVPAPAAVVRQAEEVAQEFALPIPEMVKPAPEIISEPEIVEEPVAPAPLAPIKDPELPLMTLTTGDENVPSGTYDNRDNSGAQPSEQIGKYSVDEFTGVFSYSVPIELPQGRAGLQPDIALNYNHRQHNLGSMVGYGWSIAMPSITRENRTGIDNIYDENYFLLNGSQLVSVNVDVNGYGTYGKLVESDFAKIEFDSANKWIVTDKLGTVYTYGSTATARQDNPSDSSQVYKWMLEETRDTNDNYIKYEYYKDSGQIYPKKIIYTGHGTTDGIFEVDFEPFANSTPTENNLLSISYQTGFAVQTKYLVDSIDVKIDGSLVSSYDLDLNLNTEGNKYLLSSIIPKYYKDGTENIKDKTDFDYSYQATTYSLDSNYTSPSTLGSEVDINDSRRSMFIDINNDSYTDYIGIYCDDSTDNISVSVSANDGDGGWNSLSAYSVNIPFSNPCGGFVDYSIPVAFAELNGDHMIDMVSTANNTYYYNTGSGWTTESKGLPVNLYQSNSEGPMDSSVFQDMNGDGYDDIIFNDNKSNAQSDIIVYMRDPVTSGWAQDTDYNVQVDMTVHNCLVWGGSPFGYTDLNSDGLVDVFYSYFCRLGGDYSGSAAYLNTGSGFVATTDYGAPVTMSLVELTGRTNQYVKYVYDIDGDGIYDAETYHRSKWQDLEDQMSQGSLGLLGQEVFSTGTLLSHEYFNNTMPVAIADINGDQVQDVIHSYNLGASSYDEVYIGRGNKLDILEKINYQSGATLHVYYDYSANEKDDLGNLENPELPFNTYIVKEVVSDDGFEHWQGRKYSYSDGDVASYTSDNIKDVYGFAKVSKEVAMAKPDIDLGDGSDGAFISSGNTTWTTDKNFTSLNIQSGHTITVEPDVVVKVQGNAIINGILSAEGQGYEGSLRDSDGEGPGGGGRGYSEWYMLGGGGGAGHLTSGQNGYSTYHDWGLGGPAYGFEYLEPIYMGSGGGGGHSGPGLHYGGSGGDGGGIIQLFASNITVNGEISADGDDGYPGMHQEPSDFYTGGGGGGSGGSIYLRAFNVVDLGSSNVHALGGQGGDGGNPGFNPGGDGADGRIRVDAQTVVGSSSPNYYYNSQDFEYSIDYSSSNPDLQKVTNYFHTAKQDGLHLHGRVKQSEKLDAQDTVLTKEFTTWHETSLGDGRKFVYDYEKSNIDLTGAADKATAFRNDYDLTSGNLDTKEDLGEVTVNSSTGQITSVVSGDEKDTDYLYAENTTKHILSAPKTRTISDIAETKEQDLYYNNQAHGSVDKVNLTKEDYKTDNVEVNRNFNSYGLAYEEISPENATTTIAYDSDNMYPHTTTDPLNNVTYTEYNLLNGQVATSTAPNNMVTVNDFDAFGRLKEVKISDPDNPTTLVVKQQIAYQDTTLPRHQEIKDYFDVSNYVTSREYYDGLDRVIQKKAETDTANEYATVDISYDSQGRVERQSLPYITSSIDYSAPNLSQPAKSYIYDALDRVLTETTPVGTTSYDYDGFTTTITDAENNQKELTKDAYGNLVQVKEFNNGSTYTTDYEYTLTNKMKKITDSQGNIRNFHYDALDNLDWQDMVHRSTVTTPEKIEYTHDKNGNVKTETTFKGDSVSYDYDDLGRVTYEKVEGVNNIHYVYDENGDIGQMTKAYYYGGNRRELGYDVLGRLTTMTQYIESEPFAMEYDYNLNGDIKEITYPNNWVVNYGFNSIGQVDEVTLDKGSGPVTLVDNIEYNQNGQMTHFERANGVATDYVYDPLQNFRLTSATSTVDTTDLQAISYTYDDVGNITQLVDSSDTDLAKTVSYEYDDLYRLATSTVAYVTHPGDNYQKTYQYDEVGNMTYNSALGTMDYNNDNPHQLSGYGSRTFSYDDAGNMYLNGGYSKFAWDHRNRLKSSYDIASEDNTYYKYDHNNQRFIKYTEDYIWIPDDDIVPIEMRAMAMGGRGAGGHYEWRRVKEDKYVDDYFEKNFGDHTRTHIKLNGIKIATIKDNNDPYYILGDHLGSSSILTDDSGNIAELSDYLPFGKINYENITTSLGDDYEFTGKEYDEENELQYYGARYMDNEIGNFLSIDPAILLLHDKDKLESITSQELSSILSQPQLLNSYSYVINNPVKLSDPNGEFVFLAPLLYAASAYVIANTVWDAGNVALSAYYFANDQSGENAAFLAGDISALSSPLFFGGFGTMKYVNNRKNQQMSKVGNIDDVVRLRHVTDQGASSIRQSGFENRDIWTLDINTSGGRGVSDYYQVRRQDGDDFGVFDINLPRDVFNDLRDKGLINFRSQYSKTYGNYDEIIIDSRASETVNKYIDNK